MQNVSYVSLAAYKNREREEGPTKPSKLPPGGPP